MSTLKEIVDKIKSNLESGFTTDETRLDDLFIESKVHSARGMILSNLVRSGMRDRSMNLLYRLSILICWSTTKSVRWLVLNVLLSFT